MNDNLQICAHRKKRLKRLSFARIDVQGTSLLSQRAVKSKTTNQRSPSAKNICQNSRTCQPKETQCAKHYADLSYLPTKGAPMQKTSVRTLELANQRSPNAQNICQNSCTCKVREFWQMFFALGRHWLVVLDITALWDSTSIYIELSPTERRKNVQIRLTSTFARSVGRYPTLSQVYRTPRHWRLRWRPPAPLPDHNYPRPRADLLLFYTDYLSVFKMSTYI